jgi:hypothetical protein
MKDQPPPFRDPKEFIEEIPEQLGKKKPVTKVERYLAMYEEKDKEGVLEEFLKEETRRRMSDAGLLMIALYLKKKILQEDRRELIMLFDEVADTWEQVTGSSFPHDLTKEERMIEL